MDKPEYKLYCTLYGHNEDVRALAVFEDGTLVSSSRDKSARMWPANRSGRGFEPSEILEGHRNFVGAICVVNPTTNHPKGFIITGCNDKHIRLYIPGQSKPERIIKGHEDTVCHLRVGLREGTYLSSSWDQSAKVWSTDDYEKPLLILRGHTMSVWCVADLECGLIVTGSADKSVIVWSRDGKILHRLEGHTDCVRDIAAVKEDEFLTCSNDTTIRHWHAISGQCLGTYYGHENFVYGIAAHPDGTRVASCGEDKTVRIWENGEISQTIKLPAPTVWCVKFLPNGDIAVGVSDGTIRIFTCDPDAYATPEELKAYELEVLEGDSKTKKQIQDIKIDKLPDVAALVIPGQRDGQTLMVQEDNKAVAYSWSEVNQTWIKIGEVVGTPGESTARQFYNGREYDYVFSVDIQDGVPPLKLPYNKTEDPWHAAQQFIYQNGLNQAYLDQIADFIIKNSDSIPAMMASSDYADPFTGGNRYIPGSGRPNAGHATTSATNPDPFTGLQQSPLKKISYIPHKCYLKLEQANPNAILEKLKEFNSNVTEQFTEETLAAVVDLIKPETNDELAMNALWKMLLNWPSEFAFPALDVARLAILNKYPNQQLCSDRLLEIIQRHLAGDAIAANQMLTFRLLANMFSQETGEQFGLTHSENFENILMNMPTFGSKHNQVAISTYILNLSVSRCKKNDEPRKIKILNMIILVLQKFKEVEATFRTLVALGTLVTETAQDSDRQVLVDRLKQADTIVKHLKTLANTRSMNDPLGKVAKCSTDILALIN